MAKITLQGNEINTNGELPKVGSDAPDFSMVKNDLSEITLSSFKGMSKVLNIFPSLDTGTCAASVRQFNLKAVDLGETIVMNISKDLPFAQGRFCGAEGIDKVETYSVFRSGFASRFGLEITDGPLKGLCSRAIVVLNGENKVVYTQQVSEIVDEPDYDAALKALK